MISAWHLLWIVPLSVFGGIFTICLFGGPKGDNSYILDIVEEEISKLCYEPNYLYFDKEKQKEVDIKRAVLAKLIEAINGRIIKDNN